MNRRQRRSVLRKAKRYFWFMSRFPFFQRFSSSCGLCLYRTAIKEHGISFVDKQNMRELKNRTFPFSKFPSGSGYWFFEDDYKSRYELLKAYMKIEFQNKQHEI